MHQILRTVCTRMYCLRSSPYFIRIGFSENQRTRLDFLSKRIYFLALRHADILTIYRDLNLCICIQIIFLFILIILNFKVCLTQPFQRNSIRFPFRSSYVRTCLVLFSNAFKTVDFEILLAL